MARSVRVSVACRSRAAALLFFWALASLAWSVGCGREAGSGPLEGALEGDVTRDAMQRDPILRAHDLVIVDADAGDPLPDGERLGLLFVARARGDGTYGEPEVLIGQPDWREPVDVLILSGDRLLVLDSQAEHLAHLFPPPARGAVFHVDLRSTTVSTWWMDPRLRQPVGLARGPDGVVYVSDRSADPLGLQRETGALFAVSGRFDPLPGGGRKPILAETPAARVFAGPELVTPAGLLVTRAGRVLLMDADANPHGVPGTPGVLFELVDGALVALLEPSETTSPLGLIEAEDGVLYLVDCNEGREPEVYADGALFRIESDRLVKVIDSRSVGRPKALHDPAYGDSLPDGRLAVADANLDPLGLGPDGSKGFMGSGPGCIVALDPIAGTVEPLVVSPRFVTPVSVRRVRP